mgnify:CR=1
DDNNNSTTRTVYLTIREQNGGQGAIASLAGGISIQDGTVNVPVNPGFYLPLAPSANPPQEGTKLENLDGVGLIELRNPDTLETIPVSGEVCCDGP